MRLGLQRWTALLGLAWVYFLPIHAQSWNELLANIRKRFPEVSQLSTSQLEAWLRDTNKTAPILIDTRALPEFEVSHLRGARHADSLKAIKNLVPNRQTAVVLYCSVGYRSSDLASQLLRAGYTNIHNLEGSIFTWANEGKPVWRGNRELQPPEVHPYDSKWGGLLKQTILKPTKPTP